MPNVLQKGEKFAATAIELLKRNFKAPALLVHKYGEADFRGAKDDVVNVKRPPLLRARDKGWRSSNAIVVDDLVQSRIQVPLSTFPYNAVHLSPEEATLDEVDFVRDIQSPQMEAIQAFIEELVVAALSGASYVYEVDYDPDGEGVIADPRKVALRARKHFADAKVPVTGRYWLVGSSVSEAVAGHDKLLDVNTAGLPEALRDGVVGKLGGFTVVEMDALDADESYFIHESAVALAQVAPVVPAGAVSGKSVNAGGIAVTQIFDYDSVNAKDRSIVEAFAGAVPVLDPEVGSDGLIVLDGDGNPVMDFFRAVKVNFGAPSESEGLIWERTSSGTISGGVFVLSVDGVAAEALAYNATNAEIAAALNLLSGVEGVTVTGTTTKTITFKKGVVLTIEDEGLTGSDPVMAVAQPS